MLKIGHYSAGHHVYTRRKFLSNCERSEHLRLKGEMPRQTSTKGRGAGGVAGQDAGRGFAGQGRQEESQVAEQEDS